MSQATTVRGRWLRWALGCLTVMVLSLVLMLSGLWWVYTTSSGLEWLVGVAQKVASGSLQQTLKIGAVQGTLQKGLQIQRVHWANATTDVVLSDVALSMDWHSVWDRMVHVQALTIQDMEVSTTPDPDSPPLQLPDTLELPVNVRLDRLDVNRMLVNGLEIKTIVVKKLHVLEEKAQLSQLELQVEKTKIRAQAGLDLIKPYQLQANLGFERQTETLKASGDLSAFGTLEQLSVELVAQGFPASSVEKNRGGVAQDQRVNVSTTLSPFAALKVREFTADIQNLNPREWLAQAPVARLNARTVIQPDSGFTRSDGQLTIHNALPGAWYDGKLPIREASAHFTVALEQGVPKQIHLDLTQLDFSTQRQHAGQLTGTVEWQKEAEFERNPFGNAQVDLQLSKVDPSVWVALPKPLQLEGKLQLEKQGAVVKLKALSLKDEEALIQLSGVVDTLGDMPATLEAKWSGVNPAHYLPREWASPLWAGNVQGQVFAGGHLKIKERWSPQGVLDVDVHDSYLARSPLQVKAHVKGSVAGFELKGLSASLAGNSVQAQGRYGAKGDELVVEANIPHVDRVAALAGKKGGGSVFLKGRLGGLEASWQAHLNAEAQQLFWGDALRVGQLRGELNFGLTPQSEWSGLWTIKNIQWADSNGESKQWVDQAQLKLDGTSAQHRLQVSAETGLHPFSRRRALQAELALHGGMVLSKRDQIAQGWRGQVDALRVQGLWRPLNGLALSKPFSVQIQPEFLSVGPLVLQGEDGTEIRSTQLERKGTTLIATGEIPSMVLPRLSSLLDRPMTIEPDELRLKADWDVRASPDNLQGNVRVEHLSGGLQVLEDAEMKVPIERWVTTLDFNRQRLAFDMNLSAAQFGVLQASATLPVEKNKDTNAWQLAMNQPLNGAVSASLKQLTWLGPLLSSEIRTTGTGQVAVSMSGTLNDPKVNGRVFGREVSVLALDQGVRLEDGDIAIDLNNDRARLEKFEFTVYNRQAPRRRIEELGGLIQGAGKIQAEGQWNLSGVGGGVSIHLNRAALLQRADRWLMVNGELLVAQPVAAEQPLKVQGTMNTLGAYIEAPEQSVPSLGNDVVIRGRTDNNASSTPLDVSIGFKTGKLFYVNAKGLKARLDGGLQLLMQNGLNVGGHRTGRRLQATGTIQTVDGTYRAYGQDLTIERGVVNFQGPLDNLGLNVRAVRKGVAVEAGVEVTGSAQRPKVTLVSDPAVPDSEKLSWMILGRSSGSSGRDGTLLLTAAAAIFGDDDDSTTRKIAKAIGIDDLTLSTGSLTAADSKAVGSKVAVAPGADASASITGDDDPLLSQRIISLGKRFSETLYVSFDQSVTTAASILKLNYQYSRRFSVVARTGADNAVDVLYQFSFE